MQGVVKRRNFNGYLCSLKWALYNSRLPAPSIIVGARQSDGRKAGTFTG